MKSVVLHTLVVVTVAGAAAGCGADRVDPAQGALDRAGQTEWTVQRCGESDDFALFCTAKNERTGEVTSVRFDLDDDGEPENPELHLYPD